MKRGKKIAIGLLIFFSLGFIFLCASIFFLPRLIEHPVVGAKIRTVASRIIGGEFDFKRIDLSLFPAPYVVLEKPKVHFPQHGTAAAQLIEIYPDIFSLFFAKISLKKALIQQPELVLRVAKSPPGNTKTADPLEINSLVPVISDTLADVSRFTTPIEYGSINGGRIELVDNGKTVVVLRNIDAELRTLSNDVEIGVTAVSSDADSVYVSLSADTRKRTCNAHLELKNVQLGNVSNALLPENTFDIQDGVSDILVDITVDDINTISMDYDLSVPHVRMIRAGQTVDITTQGLTGNLAASKDAVTLTVSECILDSPSMQLSGSIGTSQEEPALRVQLEGRDIDIEATSEVAMAMAGTNTVVRNIFDILHAGSIPLITVTDQGSVPADLGDWDHLVVQGEIVNGEIRIPGVNLKMANAKGNVMLSKGILAADAVYSTVENSSVHNGMFKLNLKKDPLPLQVETDIKADLADLPTILRHVIDDEVRHSA